MYVTKNVLAPHRAQRTFNIVELSQKKSACSGGNNVAKSCTAQIKGSIFLKINQNYFAHIRSDYGFRVKAH